MTVDTTGTVEAIARHKADVDRLKERLGEEKDERRKADVQELIDHHEAEVKNLKGSLG